MVATDLSRLHPRRWKLLTWTALVLFAGYGVLRNYPYPRIEQAPTEHRVISTEFAGLVDEIAVNERKPAGWPIFCIRPTGDNSWDVLMYPPPLGAAGVFRSAGPRAVFEPRFLILDIALILFNLISVVYITRTRFPTFSVRSLFVLTIFASGLFLALRSQSFRDLWTDVDAYIVAFYFSPSLLAALWFFLRVINRSPSDAQAEPPAANVQSPSVEANLGDR